MGLFVTWALFGQVTSFDQLKREAAGINAPWEHDTNHIPVVALMPLHFTHGMDRVAFAVKVWNHCGPNSTLETRLNTIHTFRLLPDPMLFRK